MSLPQRAFIVPLLACAALLLATAASAQVTAIALSSVRARRFGNENLLGFDPQTGNRFAWALAVGDFNGDGADDLATGIPFDDGFAGAELADCGEAVFRSGLVGSGLNPAPTNQFLRQTPGRDPAEAGDLFGSSVAACDFNSDVSTISPWECPSRITAASWRPAPSTSPTAPRAGCTISPMLSTRRARRASLATSRIPTTCSRAASSASGGAPRQRRDWRLNSKGDEQGSSRSGILLRCRELPRLSRHLLRRESIHRRLQVMASASSARSIGAWIPR